MPEKRGRRRQRERERERRQQRRAEHEHDERDDGEERVVTTPPPRPAAGRRPVEDSLPSKRVRYAGLVLAIITIFVGILTFADAFSAGREDVDIVLRVVGGATLIVTAIGIGIIALFPAQAQAWFRRRQR